MLDQNASKVLLQHKPAQREREIERDRERGVKGKGKGKEGAALFC